MLVLLSIACMCDKHYVPENFHFLHFYINMITLLSLALPRASA